MIPSNYWKSWLSFTFTQPTPVSLLQCRLICHQTVLSPLRPLVPFPLSPVLSLRQGWGQGFYRLGWYATRLFGRACDLFIDYRCIMHYYFFRKFHNPTKRSCPPKVDLNKPIFLAGPICFWSWHPQSQQPWINFYHQQKGARFRHLFACFAFSFLFVSIDVAMFW